MREVTSLLSNITSGNCSAVYIFSAILCIFTLASPRKEDDFLIFENGKGGGGGIAEWLALFRGTKTIIETSHEELRRGVLGAMFTSGIERFRLREELVKEPLEEGGRLDELKDLISRSLSSGIEKSGEKEIYNAAVEELRKSYAVCYRPHLGLESGDVFIWLFRISDEFLGLLRERTQEALAIFAFFCVVPKRLEWTWWMQGWSTHLLSRIYLLLDEEHRLWVRWPVEEVGWVPGEG